MIKNTSFKSLIKKQVLLVEDNKLLRELGKDAMESCGVNVTTAESGYEAINLNFNNKYDLIVLDLKMPGLNGYDTLKQMKLNSRCPQVMALTGFAGTISENDLINIGFHSVLTKPYTIRQCFKSLCKALN